MRIESNSYKSTDWDIQQHGGGASKQLCGGEGSEAIGRQVDEMAGGLIGRAGTASVCRNATRSVYNRIEGSGGGVSFMAVGSLVQAIHSVEESVAPASR